jgi:uncharacterized protein (TIGR00255 family)
MIVSMTGYGDAATEDRGAHYAVEVRSLNNRYYKSVVKLPDALAGMEIEIDSLLKESLGRGSITYVLKMRIDSAEAAYRINTDALNAYLAQLRTVAGPNSDLKVELAALLALPGVCQEPRDDTDEIARHGPTIRRLTKIAIDKLQSMRQAEGRSLHTDLNKHLAGIRASLAEVSKLAPAVVEEYHKKLAARVNQLIAKAEYRMEERDLVRELALFAEKADIAEEIQRLNTHLDAFDRACISTEHAGRKLDFITQEMLREANTIASKANDAHVAGHVVDIKGAIDRLKEQVQNIE